MKTFLHLLVVTGMIIIISTCAIANPTPEHPDCEYVINGVCIKSIR